MERNAERCFGRVAAHNVERQGALALPGDHGAACLEAGAEAADHVTVRVIAHEDRPA